MELTNIFCDYEHNALCDFFIIVITASGFLRQRHLIGL